MYEKDNETGEVIGLNSRRPNLQENLQRQLVNTKKEVNCIEELLALLQNNPDINRIFELM